MKLRDGIIHRDSAAVVSSDTLLPLGKEGERERLEREGEKERESNSTKP